MLRGANPSTLQQDSPSSRLRRGPTRSCCLLLQDLVESCAREAREGETEEEEEDEEEKEEFIWIQRYYRGADSGGHVLPEVTQRIPVSYISVARVRGK